MLEYGRKGFFVRDGNIIYEFFYTEKGICEEPRVIKPIIMDGEMMEVSFITWGFEGNYYSILANGKTSAFYKEKVMNTATKKLRRLYLAILPRSMKKSRHET